MCCHHMLFHKTVQLFNITDYGMNNETIKECLSQWYVIKWHRHTFHENDEMKTSKWPQFVPDDVDIMAYMLWMNLFVYAAETAQDKKSKDAWPGMCKWSSGTWHPMGFTEHITIGEKC